MLSPVILVPALLNGLMTGAIYALVALGLTLIYGVLHIINFAHGALLTAAMFAAFFAHQTFGLDPYVAVVIENVMLYAFRADTRTINLPYAFNVVEIGTAFLAVPRVIAFCAVMIV